MMARAVVLRPKPEALPANDASRQRADGRQDAPVVRDDCTAQPA
ncbi:hypothetical protein [Xanthomonas phaseoli]|nr:hypothetical protein [Xanthomonas phaseoli]